MDGMMTVHSGNQGGWLKEVYTMRTNLPKTLDLLNIS